MKPLIISLLILFMGLLVVIYGQYNLKISYKYEVDLMETNIKSDTVSEDFKVERQLEIDKRRVEIIRQQNQLDVLFWLVLFALSLIATILFYRRVIK